MQCIIMLIECRLCGLKTHKQRTESSHCAILNEEGIFARPDHVFAPKFCC